MPRSENVGPEVVAFAGMVIDHVEDHLDARPRAGVHHRLNSRTGRRGSRGK